MGVESRDRRGQGRRASPYPEEPRYPGKRPSGRISKLPGSRGPSFGRSLFRHFWSRKPDYRGLSSPSPRLCGSAPVRSPERACQPVATDRNGPTGPMEARRPGHRMPQVWCSIPSADDEIQRSCAIRTFHPVPAVQPGGRLSGVTVGVFSCGLWFIASPFPFTCSIDG